MNGRKVTTKRTFANGVETVKTYEDDVLVSHTVNGQDQVTRNFFSVFFLFFEIARLVFFFPRCFSTNRSLLREGVTTSGTSTGGSDQEERNAEDGRKRKKICGFNYCFN